MKHEKKTLILAQKNRPVLLGADYCRDIMQVFPSFHCGVTLTPHHQNINEHGKY